jgi:hypothetical protein
MKTVFGAIKKVGGQFISKIASTIDEVDKELGFKKPEQVKEASDRHSKPDEIKNQSIISQSIDIKSVDDQSVKLLIGSFTKFCISNVEQASTKHKAASAVAEINNEIVKANEELGSIKTELQQNKSHVEDKLQVMTADIDKIKTAENVLYNSEEATVSTYGLTAEFNGHKAQLALLKSQLDDLSKKVEGDIVKVVNLQQKIEEEKSLLKSDLKALATNQLKEESILFTILYTIFSFLKYGSDDIKTKADAIKNKLKAQLQILEKELDEAEKNRTEDNNNHLAQIAVFLKKTTELTSVENLLENSKKLDKQVLKLVNNCHNLKTEAEAIFKEVDAKLVTVQNLLAIQDKNIVEPEISEADKVSSYPTDWQEFMEAQTKRKIKKKAVQEKATRKVATDFKENLEKLSLLQQNIQSDLVNLRQEVSDLNNESEKLLVEHSKDMQDVLKEALLQIERLDQFLKQGDDMLKLIQKNRELTLQQEKIQDKLLTFKNSKDEKLKVIHTLFDSESLKMLDKKPERIAKESKEDIDRYNDYNTKFLNIAPDLTDKSPTEVINCFKKAGISTAFIDQAIKYANS